MNKDKPISIKPDVYADTDSFKEEYNLEGAKKKLSDFNSEQCAHCNYSNCPFVCIEDCIAYQSHYWSIEAPRIASYEELIMGMPTLDPYINRFND